MKIDDAVIHAFYVEALRLRKHVEQDGWKWSSNYLRERVRCKYGLKFSNSQSPKIYRALLRVHPELGETIIVKTLKNTALDERMTAAAVVHWAEQ